MSDNLARVQPFPRTPFPKEHGEYIDNSVSDSVSTTTRARANMVATYYTECLGTHCPPVARREIMCWLREGVDPDMICAALDEASMAPRPSWLYASAIVKRCIEEGVKTVGDFYERQVRWKNGRR